QSIETRTNGSVPAQEILSNTLPDVAHALAKETIDSSFKITPENKDERGTRSRAAWFRYLWKTVSIYKGAFPFPFEHPQVHPVFISRLGTHECVKYRTFTTVLEPNEVLPWGR